MSIVEIRLRKDKDPNGRQFRELLAAMERVDRVGGLRSLVVHALAVLGVALWIDVLVPADFPEGLREFVLWLFAALALLGIALTVLEWRWHKIQKRCLRESDARLLNEHPHDSG